MAPGRPPGRIGRCLTQSAKLLWHEAVRHRPAAVSAENLRKRLHFGAGTARRLVAQLRSDTEATFDASAAVHVAGKWLVNPIAAQVDQLARQ
jgi:hypothetical protein